MEIKKLALDWWNSMSIEEQEQVEKEQGYYGHDIGTNIDDIISMYKALFC